MTELTLIKDKPYSLNQIIETLIDYDYTRVPMVMDAGEFSVRGDILDVYPANATNPVRLEFDLDVIVRLNSFFAHQQRSLSALEQLTVQPIEDKPILHNFVEKELKVDDLLLSSFKENEFIVHETHGIGLFKGLQYKDFSSVQGEYIEIEYKGGDKIFVPLTQLNIIHAYKKQETDTELNSLSSKKWNKQIKQAKEEASKLAGELFVIYKERQQAKGFKFSEDTDLQLKIESEFPHQLTKDQEKVIQEIKADMESSRPMERLLCGDVGYGKTEVLVRAALKALESNKQVAVLAPTTILAEQHYKTFKERLKNSPYLCGCLSRFYSKKQQTETLDQLAYHQCDIVIGTHRLLSKDCEFADLGLLIIDEEQRFGVKHKETLKKLRKNIDCISVSATPIPRTLYQSLTGAKDCSTIQTAPENRRPILTTVLEMNEESITKAINDELKRKGQIFYVYNNIQYIDQKAAFIKRLSPDCKVAVAHGQMAEGQIKTILTDFLNQKYDCLLSTTIIENGIDIPNANTIIIDEVENYGLSQIHQLRGRVGRSDKQGYAYMYYKNHKSLQQKALDRLQAIREYVSLGSGHDLALKDLEIRGAGNILGKEQHGHVVSLGFNLYCKLLDEAIHEKRGLPQAHHWLNLDTEDVSIPKSYVSDARQRLAFYMRFYKCESVEQLRDIQYDLEDRYGKLPKSMKQVINRVHSAVLESQFDYKT